MEELFANLNTDAPIFDTPSVLGPTFDLENGFIADQVDQVASLYSSELSPHLRPSSASHAVAAAEIDYLAVDEPDIAKTSISPPLKPDSNPVSSSLAPTTVSPVTAPLYPVLGLPANLPKVGGTPESPLLADGPWDAERHRLRPIALSIVADSWRSNRNPADFVTALRQRLPHGGGGVVEDSSGRENMPWSESTKQGKENSKNDGDAWRLPSSSEGAILDALFDMLVKGEATSTRLMGYLSYSLITGTVSQRALVASCLKWVNATPGISYRVVQSFSRMLAHIIPRYQFSLTGDDLTAEVREFLAAFTMIVRCAAKSPNMASELVNVLNHDRVVALVRACVRRMPSYWTQLDAALLELETASSAVSTNYLLSFSARSAMDVCPELEVLIRRLKRGLCSGITSLHVIASSIGNLGVPASDASLSTVVHTAFAVTLQVFGTEVADALRELWSQREGKGGDFPLLVNLERSAKTQASQHGSNSNRYSFKNKVQACEAIVRFLAERSSVPHTSEKWISQWGGKERLKRTIRDAIPQVQNEICTESGGLIVSMAVICCSAMCLGPALRMTDANDGVEAVEAEDIAEQTRYNEEVEESIGELVAFAVGSLEEAAMAEETPAWRSFGLWLLLLMSRSGCMLRASGCEHVRAARVLRAWGGTPTGSAGSHSNNGGSGHKQSGHGGHGGHAHHQQTSGSSAWAHSEGVSLFSASSSLAIVDASDVSGSDETIRALCGDLVQ